MKYKPEVVTYTVMSGFQETVKLYAKRVGITPDEYVNFAAAFLGGALVSGFITKEQILDAIAEEKNTREESDPEDPEEYIQ